jgi:DNA polymerase III alpha subunit
MLALLPELKVVIARQGVAGDDTLLIAPARAREPVDTGHVSGWTPAMRLSAELECLGLAISAHPLSLARTDLEHRGVTWARDLPACEDRARIRVAGVRERAQTPRTRSGKRTCFLTMEDPTGLIDVVVFEDALTRFGDVIVKHRAYIVEGVLQNNCERGIALIAERIEPYTVRDEHAGRIRLRRGVGVGPLGPTRPGAGAPEEAMGEDAPVVPAS